jgi:anti-sigma28 factor (negative regulator of flagellin synthesis)
MRLNLDTSLVQTQDTVGTGGAAGVGKSSGNSASAAAGRSDSVRISSASGALHQLASQRAIRLDALTRAVADGSYHVSGPEVSSALLRHAGG